METDRAEIVAFSPLNDEPPADGCDVCWLPGGYPELHAGTLAAARRFIEGVTRFAETRPVHGECGGYMVLGEGLEDAKGTRHTMARLLSHSTSFAKRKLHLGYRQARLLSDHPLVAAGGLVRGHEFHHATVVDKGHDDAHPGSDRFRDSIPNTTTDGEHHLPPYPRMRIYFSF